MDLDKPYLKVRLLSPSEISKFKEQSIEPLRKPVEDGDVAAGLDVLTEKGFVPLQVFVELKDRKQEFIPQLIEIFDSIRASDLERRIHMAGLLSGMGVPSATHVLFDALSHSDPNIRRMALAGWDVEQTPPISFEHKAKLLSLLDDPDLSVRSVAVSVCGRANLPGHIEKLRNYLAAAETWSFAAGAFWLLKNAPTEEHIRLVDRWLDEIPNTTNPGSAIFVLQRISEGGPLNVRSLAASVVEGFLRNSKSIYRYDQGIVRDFAATCGKHSIPILIDIHSHARDSISRNYALSGIARLDTGMALKLIRPREDLSPWLLESFSRNATHHEWKTLVEMTIAAFQAGEGPPFSYAIIDLLLDRGGEVGRSLVSTALSSINSDSRRHAIWKLRGLTLQLAINGLVSQGLLHSPAEPAVVAKVRDDLAWATSKDDQLIYCVMEELGVLRRVSDEARPEDMPPNHCLLLSEFSRATDTVFNSKFSRQVEKIPETVGGRKPDHMYCVSFLFEHRLFEYDAIAMPGDYDLCATEYAVLTALELSSDNRRLMRAKHDIPLYFFAEPEKVQRYCKAFAIELDIRR